jgi:hypothetical protein
MEFKEREDQLNQTIQSLKKETQPKGLSLNDNSLQRLKEYQDLEQRLRSELQKAKSDSDNLRQVFEQQIDKLESQLITQSGSQPSVQAE